jgi:hypothetical protein
VLGNPVRNYATNSEEMSNSASITVTLRQGNVATIQPLHAEVFATPYSCSGASDLPGDAACAALGATVP